MKTFEYLAHEIEKSQYAVDRSLNRLGAEGWELVAITESDSGMYLCAYMKREKAPKSDRPTIPDSTD